MRPQELMARSERSPVTTRLVLVEIADSLATSRSPTLGGQVIDEIRTEHDVEIVLLDAIFEDALALGPSRLDKDWGPTDCDPASWCRIAESVRR